ncbi:MAG: hypothetical protein H0U74_14075 [Bradymonadaceae bacterium]|nr:hypothetical protein [Lujinxingiaceae bacterium]
MKQRALPIIALSLVAALWACGEGVLPAADGAVHFSPIQPNLIAPKTLTAPLPELSAEEIARYKPIIDGFQGNADILLRRPDVEARLEQIESVHVVSGRYFEIVALYQTDVAKHGLSSPAAPSLAWAWMQSGQKKLARELIDRFLKERPEAAISWLLDGAYWLPDAQKSTPAALQTVASWNKVLAIDPGFASFKGFNARILRQQIELIEQRLATEPDAATSEQVQALHVEQEPAQPEIDAVAEAIEAQAQAQVEAEQTAPDVEQAAPQPQPSTAVLVAQGQIALSRGADHHGQARALFERALTIEADNINAAVGLFNADRLAGAERHVLQRELRKLAAHPQITAAHAFELGMFAHRGAKDVELAIVLFERCQQLDAAYAERAGVMALLTRLRND